MTEDDLVGKGFKELSTAFPSFITSSPIDMSGAAIGGSGMVETQLANGSSDKVHAFGTEPAVALEPARLK